MGRESVFPSVCHFPSPLSFSRDAESVHTVISLHIFLCLYFQPSTVWGAYVGRRRSARYLPEAGRDLQSGIEDKSGMEFKEGRRGGFGLFTGG